MARASKSVKKATATAGDGASLNVEMTTSTSGRKLFESDFDVKPVGVSDFDPGDLLSIYQKMLTSRRLDEKMLTLLKQGKGFFHIGCAGHEAAQAAVGFLSRPGEDWYSLYYRDMMMYLMLGGTKEEILLHHLAKADDPNKDNAQDNDICLLEL